MIKPKQSPILARLDKWRKENEQRTREEMAALFYEMLTRPSQIQAQIVPADFVWGPRGPVRRPWMGKE